MNDWPWFRPASLALLLGAVGLPSAMAQVEVSLVTEQKQFLLDESMIFNVQVINRAGNPLTLGLDDSWLRFAVTTLDGGVVRQRREVDVIGEFTLLPGQMVHRQVDLMPCFEMPAGRYSLAAQVFIPAWSLEVRSESVTVEVVKGTAIWEQMVGVPAANGLAETRKFSLLQARHLKDLVLFARVTDPSENHVYNVLPVGRLLSFSRVPEVQLDRQSNLHLLFQDGARSFNYSVISSDGLLRSRERHDYGDTRPHLRTAADGTIQVRGGLRRLSESDFPPPPPAAPLPPRPTTTNEVPRTAP